MLEIDEMLLVHQILVYEIDEVNDNAEQQFVYAHDEKIDVNDTINDDDDDEQILFRLVAIIQLLLDVMQIEIIDEIDDVDCVLFRV